MMKKCLNLHREEKKYWWKKALFHLQDNTKVIDLVKRIAEKEEYDSYDQIGLFSSDLSLR